ncbi:hypothetical protein B0H13DRAFT_1860912 [Mycena leptocephala]|nr:hypothetical protein B0H13DRAFT_1860912 [Mycena leptocephala]
MFGIRLSVTTSLAIMTALMQVHGSAIDLTEKRQTGLPGQVLACTEPGFTGYCATVTTPQNGCIVVTDPLLVGNISSILPAHAGNGQDCFYHISTLFSIFGGISDLASSGNDNKVTGFSPIDLRFGTDASLIFDRGGGYGSDGVAELQLAEVETAMMRIRRQWNLRVLLTMLVCKRVHKKRSINRIFYWVGQDGLCPLP